MKRNNKKSQDKIIEEIFKKMQKYLEKKKIASSQIELERNTRIEIVGMAENGKERLIVPELREKYGYTQKKMSELLGIERSTYTYYETGKTEPSLRVLRKMAVVFHVSTDYLVDMSDTKNSIEEKMLSPYWRKKHIPDNNLKN